MKKKVIKLTESDIENLVKKIIKEDDGVQTKIPTSNLLVNLGGKKYAYISTEMVDFDTSELISTNGGDEKQYTTSTIIPLVDYKSGKGVNPRLQFSYSTKSNQGVIRFVTHNDNGDLFKVLEPQFHTGWKKILSSLEEIAIEKMGEKRNSDNPAPIKKKGMFGRMFGESKIDEAGGYDSPELGAAHSQNTMEAIYGRFKEISEALEHVNNMRYDIVDSKLGRETVKFLRDIEPVMNRFGKAWVTSEKKRLNK